MSTSSFCALLLFGCKGVNGSQYGKPQLASSISHIGNCETNLKDMQVKIFNREYSSINVLSRCNILTVETRI